MRITSSKHLISIILLCCGLGSAVYAYAADTVPLNQISLQLSAEQWLTTGTALVTISINAAVNENGVDAIQAEVLQRLHGLANEGDWHVISISRQLDKSGLENIQLMARARLPQSLLSSLRHATKAMSKPGETFNVDDIAFVPSDEEQRQLQTLLRQKIYEAAQSEITLLNKSGLRQSYFVHQITFQNATPSEPFPLFLNRMYSPANNNEQSDQASGSNTPHTFSSTPVSTKVSLQANVILAAKIPS